MLDQKKMQSIKYLGKKANDLFENRRISFGINHGFVFSV